MNENFKYLNREIVKSYQIKDESLIINFDSKFLIIHNKWKINTLDGSISDASLLVGTEVTNLTSSENILRIEFGKFILDVDFSENAWSGPEAAVFYLNGVPKVVWT